MGLSPSEGWRSGTKPFRGEEGVIHIEAQNAEGVGKCTVSKPFKVCI